MNILLPTDVICFPYQYIVLGDNTLSLVLIYTSFLPNIIIFIHAYIFSVDKMTMTFNIPDDYN